MISSKTYVTLERVVAASSVGLSTLELLFNYDIVIIYGNDSEFNLIVLISICVNKINIIIPIQKTETITDDIRLFSFIFILIK